MIPKYLCTFLQIAYMLLKSVLGVSYSIPDQKKRVEMYYKNTNTFVHLTIQVRIYLTNNLGMPGIVLGAGDTVMNKRQVAASHKAYPRRGGREPMNY